MSGSPPADRAAREPLRRGRPETTVPTVEESPITAHVTRWKLEIL
jgi:hypothetical protein